MIVRPHHGVKWYFQKFALDTPTIILLVANIYMASDNDIYIYISVHEYLQNIFIPIPIHLSITIIYDEILRYFYFYKC